MTLQWRAAAAAHGAVRCSCSQIIPGTYVQKRWQVADICSERQQARTACDPCERVPVLENGASSKGVYIMYFRKHVCGVRFLPAFDVSREETIGLAGRTCALGCHLCIIGIDFKKQGIADPAVKARSGLKLLSPI